MSIEAVIVAGNDEFRIVRQEEGNKVTYFLELPDGCDALGVERWRTVDFKGIKIVPPLVAYIITQSRGAKE